MIFLLVRKWRGVINIASMRGFPTYDDLYRHIQQHPPEYWSDGEPHHVYRVYGGGRDAKSLSVKESRALGLRPPKEKR